MSERLTSSFINAVVADQFPASNIVCEELGDGFAVARLAVDQEGLRPGGFVSGPSQFALMDSAFWFGAFVGLGRVEVMAMTSELSIRYLRPAQGDVLFCRAEVESISRRSVVLTGHVWADNRTDKVTATGQGTYAIPLPR